MKRVVESLIGVALVSAGLAIAFLVEARGDMLVIFFVGAGMFLVSKSLVIEFVQKVWGTVRGGGGGDR